ncbi:13631_t:CDS:2, partial [Gigaspora margarita]
PETTKSKDKKKEMTSKCVRYIWQINLSYPEKNNSHKVVYVTKLVDEHKNHTLDRAHYDFQESLEFTVDMIKDVEFFVTKMKYSSQQIHKALEEKHSVKIYMPILHRVIRRFRSKPHDQMNNTSHLYEELLKKKEIDPRWYVEVDWDHNKDKKTEYALFRASIPKAVLVTTADTILPNVYNMLRKYLIVEMLKIQKDQIKQALHYHAVIVSKNELRKYLN